MSDDVCKDIDRMRLLGLPPEVVQVLENAGREISNLRRRVLPPNPRILVGVVTRQWDKVVAGMPSQYLGEVLRPKVLDEHFDATITAWREEIAKKQEDLKAQLKMMEAMKLDGSHGASVLTGILGKMDELIQDEVMVAKDRLQLRFSGHLTTIEAALRDHLSAIAPKWTIQTRNAAKMNGVIIEIDTHYTVLTQSQRRVAAAIVEQWRPVGTSITIEFKPNS